VDIYLVGNELSVHDDEKPQTGPESSPRPAFGPNRIPAAGLN
jgi:hypothetical protein